MRRILLFLLLTFSLGELQSGTAVMTNGGTGSVVITQGTGTAYLLSASDVVLGGLTGYWKLNDNAGLSAADSASTHTGTLTNGPTWATGISSSAVSFTAASSQYISLAGSPIIGNVAAFSVSAWVKTTGTSTYKVFSESNSGSLNDFFYISVNENLAGDCEFGMRDDAGINSIISSINVGSNDGNWHHLVAVQISKSSRLFYFDNTLIGINTTTLGTMSMNVDNIGVFQRTTFSNYMDGTIDQVRTYSVGSTNTQVRNLYNAQK